MNTVTLNELVRELTKAHPLPKSKVREMVVDWAVSQAPEKRVVDIDEPDDETFNEAIGFNQGVEAYKDNLKKEPNNG